MNEDRDIALLNDCKRGDRKALDSLVRRYERPVYNAAYRMLGNPDEAADVTQTVFLKAFENLDRFNPKYKFFSWIYRIAINESINQLKKRGRTEPPGGNAGGLNTQPGRVDGIGTAQQGTPGGADGHSGRPPRSDCIEAFFRIQLP